MSRTNSPLRYPGGKSCMKDTVVALLRENRLERGHYAEPYAGGCGLALSLLFDGYVSDIHINDIDRAIWAFWKSVLSATEEFADLIMRTPVTLDEWRRQRAIYQAADASRFVTLGFSAFFLNRTNVSGVIASGGIIGGMQQTGNYKIDCRFNRDELAKRVRRIAKYKDRIHLSRLDALDFIGEYMSSVDGKSLMFVDPPYYGKGAELYTNFYEPRDHEMLALKMTETNGSWMMTYDNVPTIRELYNKYRQYLLSIYYSLNSKRTAAELMIASRRLKIPSAVADWEISTGN